MTDKPSDGFWDTELWRLIAGYGAAFDADNDAAMDANLAAIEKLVEKGKIEARIAAMEECLREVRTRQFPLHHIRDIIAAERAKLSAIEGISPKGGSA